MLVNSPAASRRQQRFDYLLFAIVFTFTVVLGLTFIQNQLWQDELYTLKHFVLVPLEKTLADYHSTNNHLVFSLIMSGYLKAVNADFKTVLLHPEIARIVPFAFTLLNVCVLYFFSRRIFGEVHAIVLLIVYCTSLQVHTFGTQCRGYSLELLLSTTNLLLMFRFAQTRISWLLAGIATTGALMLINLPSTIYYYVGLLIAGLGIFLARQRSAGCHAASLQIFFALLTGFAVFIMYFVFVVGPGQVTGNELIASGQNSFLSLIKQPFTVAYRYMDWRWFFIVPAAIFFFRKASRDDMQLMLILLFAFVVPFFLFAIHNPEMVLRIWVVMLPLFCVIMAHLCMPIIGGYLRGPWLFFALSAVTLLSSIFFLQKRLLQNNATNRITLDLRYQYHLYGFNPMSVIDSAAKHIGRGKVVLCEGFPAGIRFYIDEFNVDVGKSENRTTPADALIANDESCEKEYRLLRPQPEARNAKKFYKWYILK